MRTALAMITAIIAIIPILGFAPSLGFSYYIILGCIASFIIFCNSINLKFDMLYILLYIACVASILFNNIPSFFQPWQRLSSFIIVLSLISSVVYNDWLLVYRKKVLKFLLVFSTIIVVLSFPCFFLGISYDPRPMAPFAGLTSHSMILSPIAGISSLFLLCKLLYNSYSKKIFYTIIILIIVCCLVMLISASRTAIISFVISALCLFYKNQGFKKALKSVLVIFVVVASTYPLWRSYTESLERKAEYSEMNNGLISTREAKWIYRFKEFNSNPLWGIGFASISTKSGDIYDKERGIVEPGSSWGAVLAMIGLLGFIPFSILVLRPMKFLFQYRENVDSIFIAILTIFFCTHMISEGYVLAAGSFMFFYLWITVSLYRAESNNINKII